MTRHDAKLVKTFHVVRDVASLIALQTPRKKKKSTRNKQIGMWEKNHTGLACMLYHDIFLRLQHIFHK